MMLGWIERELELASGGEMAMGVELGWWGRMIKGSGIDVRRGC